MKNASKHKLSIPISRPIAVSTVRGFGVVMISLALLQSGQLMQKDDEAARQEEKIQALYIALEREQAGLVQNGQQPKTPSASAILEKPGIVLGNNALAGG